MPMSVGAAFTRYKIGQGLPLPSEQTLKDLMVTLNESQPVEMEEVQSVRSLAISLGASDEGATTDQMRRAIAAWYVNIERAETTKTSLAIVSLQDAHKKVSKHLDSLAEGGRVDDIFTSLQAEGFVALERSDKSAWSWGEMASNLSSAEGVKKQLHTMQWQTILPMLVCMLMTVGPYVALTVVVLVDVITVRGSGNCETNLRAPLIGWVVTEIAFWAFAAFLYGTCVEHKESIKKLVASALGVARLFVLIIGIIATTSAHRRHCNDTLFDLCMALFVYIPLIVLMLLCCAPLLTGCCVLLPSWRSAAKADHQITGILP